MLTMTTLGLQDVKDVVAQIRRNSIFGSDKEDGRRESVDVSQGGRRRSSLKDFAGAQVTAWSGDGGPCQCTMLDQGPPCFGHLAKKPFSGKRDGSSKIKFSR